MYVMHLMRSSWNKLFTSYLVYFQASSRWAIFVMFFGKSSHFTAIRIKIYRFLEAFERTILQKLESQLT